jgi:hypothetical protein
MKRDRWFFPGEVAHCLVTRPTKIPTTMQTAAVNTLATNEFTE